MTSAHQRAVDLLTANMDKLHTLAETLLEKETLESREIDEIVNGPSKDKDADKAEAPKEESAEPGEGAGEASQKPAAAGGRFGRNSGEAL